MSEIPAYQTILVERRGAVGLVTLNRPQALNALNAALVAELSAALDDLEADSAIGAIVLTGNSNTKIRRGAAQRIVMHGLETTVPVTLDMMILQGHAVMRGSKRALVVIDLPFGSYEASKEQAFHSAARVLKETGCGAIKVEGGRRMAETIAFLVERGVPVMGMSVLATGDQHDRFIQGAGP